MENTSVKDAWQKEDIQYKSNDFVISLHENHLMGDGKYYATPVNLKTLDSADIVKDMEAQGKTDDVSVLIIEDLVDSYNAAVLDRVKRGFRVNTGLCTMSLGVHGVFDSDNEQFSADKHTLVMRMTPSDSLKESLADINAVITPGNTTEPKLAVLTDLVGMADNTVTPGGLVELTGSNIKVVGVNPACGITFTSLGEDGAEVKVEDTAYAVNERNRVVFLAPSNLTAGGYTLTLTTQYMGSSTSFRKDALSVTWPEPITVA